MPTRLQYLRAEVVRFGTALASEQYDPATRQQHSQLDAVRDSVGAGRAAKSRSSTSL